MIKNWNSFLKTVPKPGVYLFIGKEGYLLNKIIEHIKESTEKNIRISNYFALKQKELPEMLMKGTERSLFDSAKKIIKIELAKDFKMKKRKDLEYFLETLPKISNYVLLYGKTLNSKSKFTELSLSNGIPVFYVYPLNEKDKFDFIRQMLEKYSIKPNRAIIMKILKRGPKELYMLESEIRKLSLYAIGKQSVTEEDIDEVFFLKKEEEIDNLLNNLFKIQGKKILNNLFKNKVEPLYIWSAILNYFLSIFWIKRFLKENANENFIINRFGLYYNKKNLIRVAKFFDDEKLKLILNKLYSIEKDFKFSPKDKKYLIENFIDFLNLSLKKNRDES